MSSKAQRIKGCLLGGAVGDALGAAVEFDDLKTIRDKHGPRGLRVYAEVYGRKGAITDDTQMTLWTAEGLLRGLNRLREKGICHLPSVIGAAYARWMHTQGLEAKKELALDGWLIEQKFLHHRRAPGRTCVSALEAGSGANDSKGCGGVMRVAPVGLVVEEPFALAVQAAELTHGHPTGGLAAGAFAHIIAGLLIEETLPSAIRSSLALLAQRDHHEETTAAIKAAVSAAMTEPPTPETIESLGAGWVAEEALAISLYCALTAKDFESGVLVAINHGGDSDSTGAITGNLLGTMHGVEAIPESLLAELEGRDAIERVADDLFSAFIEQQELDWDRYPGW